MTTVFAISSCCNCNESTDNKSLFSFMELGSEKDSNYSEAKKNPIVDVATIIRTNTSRVHYGLDISHYQGNLIEEMNPKDSIRFVICKATQGDYYIDPDFRTNWHDIKEKGMIRGTYHFYVCADDPVDQANHFTAQIEDIGPTDIAPILDIEQGSMTPQTDKEKMQQDILVFLKKVESKTNRKPILYTDYAFAQEFLQLPEFADYDLWLAEYSRNSPPLIPDTWQYKGYKIWQRTDNYSIESRKADMDIYRGTLADLVK